MILPDQGEYVLPNIDDLKVLTNKEGAHGWNMDEANGVVPNFNFLLLNKRKKGKDKLRNIKNNMERLTIKFTKSLLYLYHGIKRHTINMKSDQ